MPNELQEALLDDPFWDNLERQVLRALPAAYAAGEVEVAGIEHLAHRMRAAVALGLTARLG